MRNKIIAKINKHWRKGLACFFASLIIVQALSGVMDVVAFESGKVSLAQTQGKYYGKDITLAKEGLNPGIKQINKEVTLKKEPLLNVDEDTYDASLEVVEQRTVNSKTYQLEDKSYVQETYFEPIHKKEGNELVEIDNTLKNTSRARSTAIYENKDGLYTFKAQNDEMSITNENGQSLTIKNTSANLQTYSVKENVILYSGAYNNMDMEYRLHGNAVSTNFIVYGMTSTNNIELQIHKGNLKVQEEVDALTFLDDKNNVVFSYTKPIMYDGKEGARATDFTFQEKEEIVSVSMQLDTAWMNDVSRIYPLQMQARIADESAQIDVETAYNRSLEPNTVSRYYDLYVGYEDGSISGGIPFGATRTYINVKSMNLGPDKLIIDAKLKLYKTIGEAQQWTTIEVGKSSGPVSIYNVSWANKPSFSRVSTTDVGIAPGLKEFNIKSYIEDIYNGKNNMLELKATNESAAYSSNVFSSESGTGMPKISVTYRDAFDVNPNLPYDTFDAEMRIFSIFDRGWEALSFDGIARPDTDVVFDLVERGKNDVITSVNSKGKVDKYFINPIYITNYIANTQRYGKEDINYTTDYIYKEAIPKFDTPYEYKVKVKSNTTISTKEFRSDSFIKYKVKTGDNIQSLAAYYGLTINEIKADNNLTKNTIKEDDILIIRFKKNNDKVSKDVYTPPVRTIDYSAKYVNRGPRCSSGTCPIIDPVNATTGNYYYEGSDFTIKDAEEFDFMRYYNSTGPQISNMFGNGFTTPIESYISYDKNGNMLYFNGDGKIFEFKKNGTKFIARKEDAYEISMNGEKVTILDLETRSEYTFSEYGYLSSIVNKEGTKTIVNYDDYGLITTIKVAEKTIAFTYNDNKLVKEVTLPSGKKTSYTYDENRNLISYKDTLGKVEQYTYDDNNYLTSIKDKNGFTITKNTYDAQGRVTKQIDGNGNVTRIEYESDKSKVYNADGTIDEYAFNAQQDIVSINQDGKESSTYTYDEYRNITSSSDADGNVTKYTYDKYNLLKTEYPDGTYEEYRYDSLGNMIYERSKEGNISETTYSGYNVVSTINANNQTKNYVYDAQGRVVEEIDSFGVSKKYTYDGNMIASITHSNGLVESFVYDTNGNTVKESDNQGKVTSYIYNANNQMTQKNYYDGSNEQWEYDGNGNVVRYKDRISGITYNQYDKNNNLIISSKGGITTSKTYNEVNQLLSETDEKGLTTSYTYDIYGNKTAEIDAYGNATTYTYDALGNVMTVSDALGNSEVNEYDNANLIKTTNKQGLVTTFEYDDLNREIKKVNPNKTIETKQYDGLLLVREVNDRGTIITHEYDAFAREIKTVTTYPDGVISTSENVYDSYGNVIETTVDGAKTTQVYNVYNQLVESIDALGNKTRKQYDFDGNVVKEIDALNNEVIIQYDGLQNEISVRDKNGHTSTKTYNENGQLIQECDALGFYKTYTYNEQGLLVESSDAYNHKVTYVYDAYANVIETKLEGKTIEKKEYDKYGREIYAYDLENETKTQYDNFGRVSKSTNVLSGLSITNTYDAFDNIIEERDSEGLITSNEYDIYNRKVKTIDAYGREETNVYNVRDQVIKTNAFDKTITSAKFDVHGNVVESTDAFGKKTKNTYNILNQLVKEEVGDKVSEFVYDANGQQIEVINRNNGTSTKTIYDKNGNIVETIDALGHSKKSIFDANNQIISQIDANGNTIQKQYDAYGNVIKETDALGFSKQTKYNAYGMKELEIDERGFDVSYEYNDDLLLTKVKDANNNTLQVTYNDKRQVIEETNANNATTKHEYDVYGREVKTIHPNGKVTTITYDALGNVVEEVDGVKVVETQYDALGRLTETKVNGVTQEKNEYNKYNQVIKKYDANHNKSTYRYDVNGNVVYTNEKGYISEKEYDIYGNLIQQIDNDVLVVKNTYDVNNRVIKVEENGNVTLLKTYDPVGNEIGVVENGVETKQTFNANNKVIKVELPSAQNKDEFVAIQSITYDESGNPIKISDANGNSEEMKYDANNNVIEEKGRNGAKTLFQYDALNNVVKVQNNEDRYISYSYDEMNNVTLKNINNKFAQYEYDTQGNLIAEENENGYKTSYAYDNFGRKIKQTNADQTVIKYKYDNMGNILSEGSLTFTYDERGNKVSATNKEGSVKTKYDAFNNKIKVEDSNGEVITYTYTDSNKIATKQYAGIKVFYTYNENGVLESVKKNDEVIAQYEYNARNEVTQLKQANTITNKTYDDMGLVLTQKTTKGNTVVFNASYEYDNNDNIIKEVIDGKTNTYTYDTNDELVESTKYVDGKKVKTTYQYDIYGNQVSNSSNEGKKTYKYNDKGQISSIDTNKGIIKFSYDANGNVQKKINEDGRIDLYTYDEFNQLTQLQQGQYTYDYKYDAEKERISQKRTDTKDYHFDQWYTYSEQLPVVSDETIKTTFASLKEQVREKKSNGNVCSYIASDSYDVTYFKQPETTTYVVDRNVEFSTILKENDTVNVYGENLLQSNDKTIVNGYNDSVVAEVSKNKVEKLSYFDYGETKSKASGHGYNGEMLDQSGLLYLRARYYDPGIARFVQIDKNYDGDKQNVASQNKYVYTLNNPYKYVDSSGNSALSKAAKKVVKKTISKTKITITGFAKQVVSKINTYTAIAKNVKKIVSNTAAAFGGVVKSVTAKTSEKGGGKTSTKKPPKKVNPEAKCPEKVKSSSNSALDTLQDVLDWIGWLPGIGEICDGINAVISFLRGMFLACAISVACLALPVVADAIFKPIKKLVSSAGDFAKKAIEGLSKAGHKPSKIISGIKSFCEGVKSFVKGCWLIPGKIKTKVSGWIDSAKRYVSDIFEKAQNALSPKLATNTGMDVGGNTVQEIAKEGSEKVGKETGEKVSKEAASKGASGAGNSVRDQLLNKVENPKLKNAVNEIYRPGATTGDGGLADAVRHELSTGELVGGKSHITKATERVTNLENIINKQNLSSSDLEIAKNLLDDLKKALGGK